MTTDNTAEQPEDTDEIARILAQLPDDLPLTPEEEAIIDRLLDDDNPWHAIITALLG